MVAGIVVCAAIGLVIAAVVIDRAPSSMPAPSATPSSSGSAPLAAMADGSGATQPAATNEPELVEIQIEPDEPRTPSVPPSPVRRPTPLTAPPPTPTPTPAPETPPNGGTVNEDAVFPGVLVLSVDVASEIMIDGSVRVASGLGGRFELKPGKHTLRITAPRRQTVERDIDIQTAATTTMSISAGAAPSTEVPPPPAVDAGVAGPETQPASP